MYIYKYSLFDINYLLIKKLYIITYQNIYGRLVNN